MSRTRKGSKPAGFEFWSARPGNKHGNLMGKDAKRFTHRRERQEGRRSCRAVADEPVNWRLTVDAANLLGEKPAFVRIEYHDLVLEHCVYVRGQWSGYLDLWLT